MVITVAMHGGQDKSGQVGAGQRSGSAAQLSSAVGQVRAAQLSSAIARCCRIAFAFAWSYVPSMGGSPAFAAL